MRCELLLEFHAVCAGSLMMVGLGLKRKVRCASRGYVQCRLSGVWFSVGLIACGYQRSGSKIGL